MGEWKRQIEWLGFYNKAAIEKKMEAMAARGWLVEQPGNYIWRYRRIQPQKLHICVTYFPNASDFDPQPMSGQEEMEDFCARDGWKIAARWGQMQIFYNDQPNPAPIETDPVTQVQTVCRAVKKMLFSQLFYVALCLWQMVISWRAMADPVAFFSTPFRLAMAVFWLLLLCSSLLEIYWYLRWKWKATRAGVFWGLKSSRKVQAVLLGMAILMLLISISESAAMRWGMLLWIGGLTVICLGVYGAKAWMKKKKVSREMNLGLGLLLGVLLTVVVTGGMAALILRADFRVEDHAPVGSYDRDGRRVEVYDDPLPLYVEDLTTTDFRDWSKEAAEQETPFLFHGQYQQNALTEDQTVPDLRYKVTRVKVPWLYGACKKSLLDAREEKFLRETRYEPVDAAPWEAEEAYRLYWDGEYLNCYLLCYQTCLVEICLDWEPTPEQMGVVAKRLAEAV